MCLHIIYMLCKLFYIIYTLTKYTFTFIFIDYIYTYINTHMYTIICIYNYILYDMLK